MLSACVLLVFAAVVAAGCNPFQPRACTAIGCTDGLIVEVTGAPTGASVTVTAIAPDGSSKSGPCLSTGTACTAYLDGFMPATATLRVSWNSNTVEFEITPAYVTTYPNGRDCPPACVQAHVALTVSP
ncbi:MAG: hypothetical protein ACM3NQ_13735 [Bacteroidales bacterium]